MTLPNMTEHDPEHMGLVQDLAVFFAYFLVTRP